MTLLYCRPWNVSREGVNKGVVATSPEQHGYLCSHSWTLMIRPDLTT